MKTYPAEEGETIIIHGIWMRDNEFWTDGKRLARAIPNLPTLINLYPGVIVPGKPLKQFAAIHKDDGLILTFPTRDDLRNQVMIATTGPDEKVARYHATMYLQPTPEALNSIGFKSLIKANLGHQENPVS